MISKDNLPTEFLRAIHREPALRQPNQDKAFTQLPAEKFAKEAFAEPRKPLETVLTPGTGQDSGIRVTAFLEPMGKPRMTQRDKWKKRPVVVRYREWCDKLRAAMPENLPGNPVSVSWKAYFSMPESWTKKKKAEMKGQHHRQKPDRDNCDKAILDCLWKDDSVIACGSIEKQWDDGQGARIELEIRT